LTTFGFIRPRFPAGEYVIIYRVEGADALFLHVFDYCQNLEFFQGNPQAAEPGLTLPLGKRLFLTRLEPISALDHLLPNPRPEPQPGTQSELRSSTAGILRDEVAAMNVENFVVRPKRKLVEKYREAGA